MLEVSPSKRQVNIVILIKVFFLVLLWYLSSYNLVVSLLLAKHLCYVCYISSGILQVVSDLLLRQNLRGKIYFFSR
jgi:hypothetical protein